MPNTQHVGHPIRSKQLDGQIYTSPLSLPGFDALFQQRTKVKVFAWDGLQDVTNKEGG